MRKTIDMVELANLINQGFRPTAIYRSLGISETHFYRLKQKLKDHNMLEKREVVKFV